MLKLKNIVSWYNKFINAPVFMATVREVASNNDRDFSCPVGITKITFSVVQKKIESNVLI